MKIGDLMQKFFMSNPKRAKWFISTMPASFWEKQGRKKALATFHEAATKVPAYREFLNDSKINPNYVKDYNDFQKIPFTDKKKYLLKSNLKDLCLDGSLRGMYVICRSSGSSGKALYWPRVPKQDEFLPYGLEQMYRLY
ncbi:MAG: hypothetical protein NT135_02610 [Candidatus Berkelbacteria bacterium]|nr:hypothetical protein [Candidatus Berkelbacteria bacterium]